MLLITNLRKPLYTNNSLVFYKRGRNRNHCCKFADKVATNLMNVVPLPPFISQVMKYAKM